jgi:hypothetical protein
MQLCAMGEQLTKRTQELRRWQFKDSKIRVFQWMHEQLQSGHSVTLTVQFHHHRGTFLNLLLTKVNDLPIRIFYVLKRVPHRFLSEAHVRITQVCAGQPFDEGTLPEVDALW